MNIIQVDHKFTNLSYGNKAVEIILHHAESKSCTVEDINRWHKNNGWSGIGYHYFVRKDGTIYKGRPDNAQGAHCPGHNSTSIGICAEGSYLTETMPEAQKKAIAELIKYLRAGNSAIKGVYKHKDFYNTNCPGTNYPFDEIVALSQSTSAPVQPSTPPVTPTPAPSTGKNDWVSRLQAECNAQGFSSQKVDGYPGPNTLAGCPTLKKGAKGKITKLLQEKLISLGFSCGKYGADSDFGGSTHSAVVAYQKSKGLSADGIVGRNTWSKLLGL